MYTRVGVWEPKAESTTGEENEKEATEMDGRNVANEAMEQLARTTASSYKALMDNTIALQERNVWFTLALFGGPANAYADLFFAPFHYFREVPRSVASEDLASGGNGGLPIQDYDRLTVGEVSEKLGDLSGQETRAVRSYERRHKNRGELLERLDRALV